MKEEPITTPIEEEPSTEIPPVPLSLLRRINKKMKQYSDDTPLSFEFIMTAFFPSVYQNILAQIRASFNEGYKKGLEDARK